ncbi:MAG TPA: hypothetical protein VI757_05795 [Bacteroidia bacterium]|nr:hypothetical protein [Bacteroidia bacterium]
MFNNLPKQNGETWFKGSDNKRNFFEALPEEFTRQQAIKLAQQFLISARSADDLLSRMLGKHFTKLKTGYYKRIQPQR